MGPVSSHAGTPHPSRAVWARSFRRVRPVGWPSASYLKKWIVLGVVIGAVAGCGAIVFYEALVASTHLFLGVLAGYHVPTPVGEGGQAASASAARPWSLPLVAGVGALLGAVLVFRIAPEAEGHGTDAAISAVHHNPRGVRFRAVIIKIVASALTIGSGGSGGREGPTGQISAGFGSLLARVLDLEPEDGRIAVATGIGSGIGAIFGAPLGGAVLAVGDPLPRRLRARRALAVFHRLGRQLCDIWRRRGILTAVRLRRQLPLQRSVPAHLVRAHRHLGRAGRSPLCQELLRHGRPVPPLAPAPMGQPGHRGAVGGGHRYRHTRGHRHRLRMGADQPRPRTAVHSAVDRPAPSLRPDLGHRTLHRFGGLGGHLRARHGDRRLSRVHRCGGSSSRSSPQWATAPPPT